MCPHALLSQAWSHLLSVARVYALLAARLTTVSLDLFIIITGQVVFTDYAQGRKLQRGGLQGGNICTISYLQMIS